MQLTKKQQEVLGYISMFILAKGISPTVRELCCLTGIRSTSTMAGYLDRLQRKGYIIKDPNSPRTLRVVKKYEIQTL